MAYLFRRPDGRVEIREALATPAGPRARTLATFRGALTPDVLERASGRARRPLDARRLEGHAARLGIPVTRRRDDRAARELLAHLRRGGEVDPALAALLRDELARVAPPGVPDELAEVAEWVGVSDTRRGEALRGLLRVADRIVRSRGRVHAAARAACPRFASGRRPRR